MKNHSVTRRKYLGLLPFLMLLPSLLKAQPDSWLEKDGLPMSKPAATYGATGFSVLGKGYVTGGFNSSELWEYNPITDKWRQKVSGPGGFASVAFTIGEQAYLANGSSQFWQYDPIKNQWTRKADYPGTHQMGVTGFSVNGKGFVGIGATSSDFWEYDPVMDKWTRKTDFPGEPRAYAVGFSIGMKGYMGTGESANFLPKKDFWEYDPIADQWTRKADLAGEPRSHAVGFSILSKGYIGTGSSGYFLNDFWEYDPSTDDWNEKASLNNGRTGAIGFSIGNKGYIGSGNSTEIGKIRDDYGVEFMEFSQAANSWTYKSSFEPRRHSGFLGFSLQNKGFVFTQNSIEGKTDFWQYEPITDLWSQKPHFPGMPREGALGLTVNGKAYIAGGRFNTGIPRVDILYLTDVWEYNPDVNAWRQRADLIGAGGSGSVSFEVANKGYVVSSNAVFEYDPMLDQWIRKSSFPGSTGFLIGFAIDNKGYVGVHGKKEFWQYEPQFDKWSRKSDFTGSFITGTAFTISNRGYIGGGTRNFYEYNPGTDTWLRKAPFPGAERGNSISLSILNRGYIAGGQTDFLASVTDFWQYTPSNSNQPPISNGWVMKYYSRTSLLMNGWGSYDPEGSPIRYAWTKVSGPSGFTMLYADASTPVISNLSVGSYTFRLTVTDNAGASASSDISFNIRENQPPVADGWLMKFNSPSSILLNSWGSYDPDGFPVTFWWDKISGPFSCTILYQNASTPVISDLVQGTYKFRLTVTDNEGAKTMDTVSIAINSLTSIAANRNSVIASEALYPNHQKANRLTLYPNPVKDMLTLQWLNDYCGDVVLTVMDMSGRTLHSMQLSKTQGALNALVNVGNLASGNYHLRLTDQKGNVVSKRFLKK